MAFRRIKPVQNYDTVQITNLEDDFDEFTLGEERARNQLFNNKMKTDVKQPKSVSSQQTVNSPKSEISEQSKTRLGKFSSEVESPDAIWKKGSKDPMSTKDHADPLGKGAISKTGNKKTAYNKTAPQDEKVSGSSPTQSEQSRAHGVSTKKPTLTSPSKADQTPQSSSRGAMTTPLNQRNPVSSVKVTKRVNRNEKGVGHDAQDMFIDDLEDF